MARLGSQRAAVVAVLTVTTALALGATGLRETVRAASPAASPAGSQDGKIVFNEGSNNDLWVMNPDGSDSKLLVTGPTIFPKWSPDGSQIAFGRGATALSIVNADGSNERQLASDVAPGGGLAWSPDGKEIAADGQGTSPDIILVNTDGSGEKHLTSGVRAFSPTWSPDGTKIVFVERSAQEPNSSLWVVGADGSDQHQLSSDPAVAFTSRAWSPDGSQIVFSGQTSCGCIGVVNADGSDPRFLTPIVDLKHNLPQDGAPAFSPDGTHIVFMRAGAPIANLWVMSADGTNPHQITSTGFARFPDWGASTVCALSGTVTDGDLDTDSHSNPLPDIEVQLWRDQQAAGRPATTDANGKYCIHPQAGATDPGSYKLRATLIDMRHDPPLFETRHGADTEATWTEIPVFAADFGPNPRDISFTGTADRSWLPDVANIHWQSWRFVNWVTGKLGVSPATFGHVTIRTFDSTEGCTCYNPPSQVVFILPADSPYSARDEASDNAPEAIEWHEVSHHVAHALGIAPTDTASACAGRIAHGGWLNDSTCDSLAEGFAEFLPTLASLDIDANRQADGYATPAFGVFGSLEINDWAPWGSEPGDDGQTLQKEEFAVAQLLWDVADDTPGEQDVIHSIDAAGIDLFVQGKDAVAFGGINLVNLLAAAKADTVADVYLALQISSSMPSQQKAKTADIDGDGKPDVSPLDEVFLLHDFHPVHDPTDPGYVLGDPVARTDHIPDPAGGLVIRHDIPLLTGSAISFVNDSSSAQTFSLDVTYATTSSHFPITVPPNASKLVHFEVPPYWHQVLAPGDPLPDCGAPDQRLVTIKLSGPGIETKTLDNCEYLHDVLKAVDGSAVTYGANATATPTSAPAPGSTPTSPPAAPAPAGADAPTIAAVVIGILVLLAAFVVFARWRRKPTG